MAFLLSILISLGFLLPHLSSFCQNNAVARSSADGSQTYTQSYPQHLWISCPPGCAIIAQLYICAECPLFSIIQAAGWPIWPLIACSILALAIVIERFVSLKANKIAPARLLEEVLGVTRTSVPTPDVVTQLEKNSALGEVLASGLRAMNADPRCTEDDLRATMEGSGRIVAQRLEQYLSALATIASAAPLMGLFGTVVGMIEIFGSQAPGGATGGNPAQLAHGISIALYNTAFGLIVAIPSLIFWRYFRGRVDGYLLTLELAAGHLARHLKALRK
jgi:biopolymer transport protein ExbB